MTGIRPHAFRFDMRDQFGRRWCVCGLPEPNKAAHPDDLELEPDNQMRAAGDGRDNEGDE